MIRVSYLEGELRDRVDGRPIALTRIMLGTALLIVTLEQAVALGRIADGAFAYPFFSWTPQPPPGTGLAFLGVGWFAGVCVIVGLLPSIMSVAGAALCLLALLWDQQLYSSHVTLLTILLLLLAFAQSGRRWALLGRPGDGADRLPGWPQLLMMTQVSVVYLFAGLSKAQPTFLSGRPLSEWMWLSVPMAGYALLAWVTVVTEVLLAVALWIPRIRWAAVIVGIALHLSIVTLLSGENLWLVAFALTTMATYPLFLTRPSGQSPTGP